MKMHGGEVTKQLGNLAQNKLINEKNRLPNSAGYQDEAPPHVE